MQKWLILIGCLSLTAAADQLSKGWALLNLQLYESIALAPPFLHFTRSSNSGAAFGILPMAGELFLLLASLIIAGLLWYFRTVPATARFLPLAFGLVIGGAIGNLLDRLQHGHVIDFIHYQIPNLISSVSNLADHAIVLGVLLIISQGLWQDYRAKTRPPAEAD